LMEKWQKESVLLIALYFVIVYLTLVFSF
jgi:hypothetical protein